MVVAADDEQRPAARPRRLPATTRRSSPARSPTPGRCRRRSRRAARRSVAPRARPRRCSARRRGSAASRRQPARSAAARAAPGRTIGAAGRRRCAPASVSLPGVDHRQRAVRARVDAGVAELAVLGAHASPRRRSRRRRTRARSSCSRCTADGTLRDAQPREAVQQAHQVAPRAQVAAPGAQHRTARRPAMTRVASAEAGSSREVKAKCTGEVIDEVRDGGDEDGDDAQSAQRAAWAGRRRCRRARGSRAGAAPPPSAGSSPR